MIGTRIGRYEITERLGQGGMGEVYLAIDRTLDRRVAIKLLPGGLHLDAAARARFEREARATSALSHPNICVIHDFGEHEGRLYLVMEHLEGETLAERLRRGPIDPGETIRLAVQVADALAAAHAARIVHRDIKPANLLITTRGDVKILDFGLAKRPADVVNPDSPTVTGKGPPAAFDVTEPGTTLGTVHYMSPEQALGQAVDPRSDVFSVGIVLYEMLTGARPFTGATHAAIWNEILNRTPARPDEVLTSVPGPLADVVMTCLEKDREARPASATDLLAALHALAETPATTMPMRSGPTATPSPAGPTGGARRRTTPLAVAGALAVLVVLVVLVGIGVRLFGGGGDAGRTETPTLAVLPFEDLSPDSTDAYFSVGMYEDVLTRLGAIAALRVISKRSAMTAQRRADDARSIGRRLGVRYVVEGAVRRQGDEVRITARLIDSETDQGLWSESYDRHVEDVFAVQAEIAQAIASALEARITPEEADRMAVVPTAATSVYDRYLRARRVVNAWPDFDALEDAIALIREAVRTDPDFVEGWALLAVGLSDEVALYRGLEGREADADSALAAADAALGRARELDPGNLEVLRAEGYYHVVVTKDAVQAVRAFDQAMTLAPNDAVTLSYLALLYLDLEQPERAVGVLERAFAIDPANYRVISGLTYGYEMTERFADMVPFLERLSDMDPTATHHLVEARYYAFLADGSRASFDAFEHAVNTIDRGPGCNVRKVQDYEMIVAMFEDDFDGYADAWAGRWDRHHAGHGDWSCPAQINDEANHAHLLIAEGHPGEAAAIIDGALRSTTRPYSERVICIFDKATFRPKLTYMTGDSALARRELEEAIPSIMSNRTFPRGAVEKVVLVQSADMVAPDLVYDLYRRVTEQPISLINLPTVCANPWVYANLIRDPRFQADVRADGRFVAFLEHHGLIGPEGAPAGG